MPYRVEFTRSAERSFDRLSKAVKDRLRSRVRALADNPRPPVVEKLTGRANDYRIRVGDYRIVYRVRDEVLIVLVIEVGHRRDVYWNLP